MTQTFDTRSRSSCSNQIFISDDDDVKFVMALEAKLEADADPEEPIEVDSLGDGTYRVWAGITFIGIVIHCSSGWIAKPTSDCQERLYSSSKLAIAAVVRAWEAV